MSEEEYHKSKNSLPDITIAIKCPIDNIESVEYFQNLIQFAQELVDHDAND